MFHNKRFKSFINHKTLSVFALTFVLGLTFNSIFGRHIFKYSITETFTKNEAAAKLNKRIRSDFSGKSVTGTVISYGTDDSGETFVTIAFDSPVATTLSGDKIYKLDYGKEVYQQFVTEKDADN